MPKLTKAQQFASIGGKALLKKRGRKYFRELSKKAAAARAKKKKKQ